MNQKKLLEIINNDILLKNQCDKYIARQYYSYKPRQITKNTDFFIKNGIEYGVKNKNTNEIYINYFKMLVTQKIDYLLSKKPSYDESLDSSGINIWTMLDKMLLNTSLDSRTWLHPYLVNNQLDYIIVKDSEIIPFYEPDGKTLKELVRYYTEKDSLNDSNDDILHVEIWTTKGVSRLTFKKDMLTSESTESHYKIDVWTGDTLDKSVDCNFKMIPFIPLINNKDETSDLYDIECLISAYNAICTGFIDNIKKFQEALLILKGYVGKKDSIKKIMDDILNAKGVSVDKDGDIGYTTVDIPVEARATLLDILRDVIFLIGRGVDPSKLAEGTNITNVVLKSRYIQLDFKSSDTLKRIIDFYERFIFFLNTETSGNYDSSLELNKSMLINETETIQNCVLSKDSASLETILKNHPWVDDVDEELNRLREQKKKELDEFNKSIIDQNEIDKNKE